ncbi:unnamed protein product [Sphenostylis stenocarpa]|uniref:Uncharacterized protein n=1 Tax=Sphenostylis stenocarpa TaxID=92480 RepID=A0AA86VMB0_9FABA|nr:unnamed protein product [Sphenostylis stenocarpa]
MAVCGLFSNLQIFPHFLVSPPSSHGFSRTFPATSPIRRAFREWREYEEAVKRKDLAGALRFLKSLEAERPRPVEPLLDSVSLATESTRLRFLELERFGPQRDWEVLDTCLNADDMKLVANAYRFLRDRGFLPNFGKCRNIGHIHITHSANFYASPKFPPPLVPPSHIPSLSPNQHLLPPSLACHKSI